MLNPPWRWEIADASVVRAICAIRVVRVVAVIVAASAFVFLLRDAAAPTAAHLAGATALATAFAQRATGFCAPLKPPSLQEGGRAKEGRTTLSRQRRRLRQHLPRPPSSSTMTIVALEPPPSSSIIAVAISLSGCDATIHTLAGQEGGALASAPASPIKIEPAFAVAGGGGTRASLRSLQGEWAIPPPLAAEQRTPRRRRWRRRRRCQHGGEQVGKKNGGHRNSVIQYSGDRKDLKSVVCGPWSMVCVNLFPCTYIIT